MRASEDKEDAEWFKVNKKGVEKRMDQSAMDEASKKVWKHKF